MTALVYRGPGEKGQHNFATAEGLPIAAYISDGIPTPQINQSVECELKQGTSKAGNPYTRIEAINGQRGTPRGSGGGQARTGGRPAMHYDPRTFVSNVVGQAIAAKAITQPDQLADWATTAYKCIMTLEPASVKTEIAATAPSAATPGAQGAVPQPTVPVGGDDIPF